MILSILIFIILILNLIARWILFSRAGRDGWRSIIPVYNQFVAHQIAFGDSMGILFILKFIPFVGPVYAMYTSYCFAKSYNGGDLLSVFSILFQPLTNVILAFGGNPYIGSNVNFLYRFMNRDTYYDDLFEEELDLYYGEDQVNNNELTDDVEYTKEETITVVEDDTMDLNDIDNVDNNKDLDENN